MMNDRLASLSQEDVALCDTLCEYGQRNVLSSFTTLEREILIFVSYL